MVKQTLKIEKSSVDKLTKSMQKSVYDAYDNVLNSYRTQMQEVAALEVPVYKDQDPLRTVENLTGLDDSIVPEKLTFLMMRTLDDIKFDKRYNVNNAHANIFNNTKLQEGTRWSGLSRKPFIYPNKDGQIVYKGTNNFMTYDDSGYRPFGSRIFSKRGEDGKLKPAEWHKNPYPGFGYWAEQDEGFISRKPGYINTIFRVLLTGNLSATRFEPTGFVPQFIEDVKTVSARYFK